METSCKGAALSSHGYAATMLTVCRITEVISHLLAQNVASQKAQRRIADIYLLSVGIGAVSSLGTGRLVLLCLRFRWQSHLRILALL